MTTFSSWKQIYDWWRSLYIDKIVASEEIKQKVAELTKDCHSEEEKLQKIFEFCAQQIRYVAVEYGKAGHRPHYAQDIFINGYGDCKDQSILLISMLKEAGIEAGPVLLATYEALDTIPTEPTIIFNHCIAYALLNRKKLIFLDPTSSTSNIYTLPSFDEDRWGLVFFKDRGKLIKVSALRKNVVDFETSFRIDKESSEYVFTRKITPYGIYNISQRYFIRYSHPQEIRQVLTSKAKSICSDAELVNIDVKNLEDVNKPLIVKYTFKGEAFFKKMANLLVPSWISNVNKEESLISLSERKYPLYIGEKGVKKSLFNMEIPPKCKVYYLPKDIFLDSPWIRYSRKFEKADNFVIFKEEFEIKKREIEERDYKKFKEFYERLLSILEDKPLFQY